jgi:2-hydroxy-3-oxopropionate reductase
MKNKIGFIGLGIMGKPMSKNLLKAGYELVVYNRSRPSMDEVVAAGAKPASSPRDVAEKTKIIITMLPNSPDVQEVVLGENGIIEGAQKGSILIDMSSISPHVTRAVASRLSEKGMSMLDAPVSGGEPGAVQGTLAVMVGGKEEDFKTCYNIMKVMGKTVTYVGDIGAGNVTKLANQIIVGLNIAAMSEAMVLATKCGVDPKKVFQAIRAGLAGSNVLDAKAPMLLEGNFEPGFRINLHYKDLANALATGAESGVVLPLSAVVLQIMQGLKVDGLGDKDHSAVACFYEKLAHVEARSKERF